MTELHCIMPITNMLSVMQHGILSHEQASKLVHHSVAMDEIQDRRDRVQVPGGLRLHQYANLYFNARNPMMYKRKNQANALCVLRVSADVLSQEKVVLTDQNASSDYVRFLGPTQVRFIKFDWVYADNWQHDDKITYWQHKATMCAEVLVPNAVLPELIIGAYVVSQQVEQTLLATGFNRPVQINAHLFFQ
uniref:DarT domain-containing protein n=1 Tax=mine drainage metagenome TaxID=410659 RepID=E6QPV8_9ZZZZ